MRWIFISLVTGWIIGHFTKPSINYVVSNGISAQPVWSAHTGTSSGQPIICTIGITYISLESFDRSLSWDSFDETVARIEMKPSAELRQAVASGKTQCVANEYSMLQRGHFYTYTKASCIASLGAFYSKQEAPHDVDSTLYAERRTKALQLCELMVVNGHTADWEKAARNGDYVDWRQAVDSCVKEGTPPALASRHLIMILKRNWDLELIDEPLSMTPARRRLIETILGYIEKGRCKREAEELLLYHKYYFRGRSEPEWDQFIARLNTVVKG